jgi:hypothetical protein
MIQFGLKTEKPPQTADEIAGVTLTIGKNRAS